MRNLLTEKTHIISGIIGRNKSRITVKTFDDGTIVLSQIWNTRESRIIMTKELLEQLKSLNL